MKCYLCGAKASIKQQKNRSICDRCFSRLIEKRIRKFTRLNKIFKPKDRILVIGEINKYLIKNITGEMPIKLFFRANINKDFVKKNKINKILIEYTLDDEINSFLTSLFKGKKIKRLDKKHIKLLKPVTDDEAKEFARINRLRFKPNKKDPFIQILIDELHQNHPNAKYTLLNNIDDLKKISIVK